MNLAKNHKQPLPETITAEDLLGFKLSDQFAQIKTACPLQFHVVAGAIGLAEDKLEVLETKSTPFIYSTF